MKGAALTVAQHVEPNHDRGQSKGHEECPKRTKELVLKSLLLSGHSFCLLHVLGLNHNLFHTCK